MSVSTELRRRAPASDGEPKSDSEKPGVSLSFESGKPLVHIDIPKGVWALLSMTFACSVTLLYVNVDMRSISIDEFNQIKNITIHQSANAPVPLTPGRVLWLHGKKLESGYLRHVSEVFKRSGYTVETRRPTQWDVLWSHDYPFGDLSHELSNISPEQKINHVPGTGFITNKVSLATGSHTKHIPVAFQLPKQKREFFAYANNNPETLWVQKSNSHRGIVAKRSDEVNVNAEGTFVQEFVANPLLVDGYKFDVGVYVVLTSLNPLRVYAYEGEALLRFCAKKYDPKSKDQDSYVVGDDYLPIWEVPSLKEFYKQRKLSMKDSLNLYLRRKGLNPDKIWLQIREAITSVYFEKRFDMAKAAQKWTTTQHFFELVRFDFLVDSDLNVHLLEANMSPNLSSAHFKPNSVLYEQVISNLLSIVGLQSPQGIATSVDADLSVYQGQCAGECVQDCKSSEVCQLCASCWSGQMKDDLASAFAEHVNRKKFRRVIPVPKRNYEDREFMKHWQTRLHYLWFEGKCQMDETFCS